MENKIFKLVTHSGNFHTDDIFATVVLSMVLESEGKKFEVIRTRDEETIKLADFVYDVGGVYDEATNRFDHHQKGGAGKNEYGIEYSSFGLVWKKFGAQLCGSQDVANLINKKLVSPIDAQDNGMDLVSNLYDVSPYMLQYFFHSMVPTWQETDVTHDERFFESLPIARKILEREIKHAKDLILAEESTKKIYKDTEDKRIIILDKNYPTAETLENFPETYYVVYPRTDKTWGAKAVREDIRSFKNRKNFPAEWGALREDELRRITGVVDAVFCHRALFFAVARSKEGAIALAKQALGQSS